MLELSETDLAAAYSLGGDHAEEGRAPLEPSDLWEALVAQPHHDYVTGSYSLLGDAYHAGYRDFS